MIRPTQRFRYTPCSLLPFGFDDNRDYLGAIAREIKSTGRFISGIDVEPSFDNGHLAEYRYPAEKLSTGRRVSSVEQQQSRWESERAAARAREDQRTSAEWDAIAAFRNEDAVIKAAECFIAGKTIERIAKEVGLPFESIVLQEFIGLVERVLVPVDANEDFAKELFIAHSVKSLLRLAAMVNWGR